MTSQEIRQAIINELERHNKQIELYNKMLIRVSAEEKADEFNKKVVEEFEYDEEYKDLLSLAENAEVDEFYKIRDEFYKLTNNDDEVGYN